MTRSRLVALWVVLAVSSIGGAVRPFTASAQDGEDPDLQRAVMLFEESERLYNQGEFAEAATLLRRAYELRPDPLLLFNLGRALESDGDLGGAIEAYEQYLRDAPNASDRRAIERRVQNLRRQQERLERVEQDDRGGDESDAGDAIGTDEGDEPRRSGAASVVPWIVAGAGVAVIGAGAAFGLVSSSKNDEALAARVQAQAHELQTDAETFATIANVCFVAGGVIAAAGVTWGVLSMGGGGDDEGAGEEELAIGIGPGSVAVRGTF